jgi:4-amino-4-deoxy-L-arabinose transferase-like glycosyltransferase
VISKALWYCATITLLTIFVSNAPFFWDTVQLASKHGHFFYETDFQSFILPEEIDSGHPPLFGAFIALVWKALGKTLPVSHFAMLPFLFGIVTFLFLIGKKILGERHAPWLCLLCFADPVLASQSLLVSPDVVLACFFLMSIWAIWHQKASVLMLAVIVLGLISTRGMMLSLALFGFSVFVSVEKISSSLILKKSLPFVPGGLLAAGYLFYHWQQTGWVGYHENSTWAPSFERIDFQGFIKNVGIMTWRLLDFGRIFVWLAIGLLTFVFRKKIQLNFAHLNRQQLGVQLIALCILVFLVIAPIQLLYKGLLAHRYFLPFFLTVNMAALYFLIKNRRNLQPVWLRNLSLPLVCLGLAAGNFWVYPQKVAMGWDSTLAHLPWYGLLEQTKSFLGKNTIPFNQVGTAFPNIGSRELYELNGNNEGFIEKDLATNCYVFYSNIMNDFTDEEIDMLKSTWTPMFEREIGGVFVILYKNPNLILCVN